MAQERSKFAGGDQQYLREEQYRSSSRLAERANLHARASTAVVPWFTWVAHHIDLEAGQRVLEVGCGAGWLWEHTTVNVPPGISILLTDLSPGMVAEAVARVAATDRFASVSGESVDTQALPFATASFERVVANHMLYHLPDPAAGVAQLARVVTDDGRVVVATNGRRHMQELWAIRAEVFGTPPTDQTVDVFGVETGFPVLRDHFAHVDWWSFPDELRCTDPADVLAYLCSTPPGETATPAERAHLEALVAAAFEAGDGTMRVTKDTGAFVCTGPSRPRP